MLETAAVVIMSLPPIVIIDHHQGVGDGVPECALDINLTVEDIVVGDQLPVDKYLGSASVNYDVRAVYSNHSAVSAGILLLCRWRGTLATVHRAFGHLEV